MPKRRPPTPRADKRGGESASSDLDYTSEHHPTEGERITEGFSLLDPDDDDDTQQLPSVLTIDDLVRDNIPPIEDSNVLVLPVVMFVVTEDQYERIAGNETN